MDKPMRTVVVGLAESQEEDPYLVPALELARRTGAEVHVVHAYQLPDPVFYPYPNVAVISPDVLDAFQASMQAQVEARVRQAAGAARVKCHAVAGPPDRVVVEMAEEMDAELVVIGATRRGTLARTILGSTAQRIVRSLGAPVLVLRDPTAAAPRRVLFTTDLSELSEDVYQRAAEILPALGGATPNTEARVLHVLGFGVPLPPPLSSMALGEAARTDLDGFLARLQPPVPPASSAIRNGDPAKEIVAEAEDWGADLLVLGTHGRGGASRFLIGSVAEAVVRNALCNVLVIPVAAVQPDEPLH